MDENPFSPPQSEIETSGQPDAGPLLPWEDPGAYPQLWDRILQTIRTLLQPTEAGQALGHSPRILPSISFMALVGLPLPWLFQLVMALHGPVNPMQDILKVFGAPAPPVDPAAQSMQRVMQWISLFLFPIFMAIAIGIWGLLVHGGLWLTRALQPGRGLETTFRTMIYSSTLMFLVSWVFNLWVFCPPMVGLGIMALSILAWVGFGIYQGILMARAHETQLWRGILGLFAPWILFLCCCGGLGAILAGIIAIATHR